jgi:16S rRNA processing protein RimM
MRIDSCFELGHVIKIHGIRGEVKAYLDTDHPENYKDLESVFVELKQKLVPFFIGAINIHGNIAIIKFEDIDSIEQAGKLLRSRLYLPLKMLSDPGKGGFYLHELIGYSVVDPDKGKLGKITSIYEAQSNKLIAMNYKGKEILIPFNRDLIQGFDKGKKEIMIDLPDGLLEIYLNP